MSQSQKKSHHKSHHSFHAIFDSRQHKEHVGTRGQSSYSGLAASGYATATGVKDLLAHNRLVENVIAVSGTGCGVSAQVKQPFEPLPFPNYSLFDEIYDSSQLRIHVNLSSRTKYIFHPGLPIRVRVRAQRNHGPHLFNIYAYILQFEHGNYKWQVVRQYKEIKEVHRTLARLVKADIGRSCSDLATNEEDIKPDWPLFPHDHDHLITSQSEIDTRCKHLAEYLKRVLKYPPFRDHPSVLALLSVSPISFVIGLSPSLCEDMLQKSSADNMYSGHLGSLKLGYDNAKIFYARRWFVLKDTFLVYLNQEENNKVGFLMLLDRAFDCKMKIKPGAYHALVVRNLQRSMTLKCRNSTQQREWYEKIMKIKNELPGSLFCSPEHLPNGSYAPIRSNQKCKWFVNGKMYMEQVMCALNNAKEEIYMCDWWLCPEIFLRRPTDDLQYRLDKILLKKAKEGVKIYILLYKEFSFVFNLDNSRAKNVLTQKGKNPNIKILRHPEHTIAGVFFWTHHEKCLVIDQSIAFMGGIDLCNGRWDDDLYRLVDLGRKPNITEIDTSKVSKYSQPHKIKESKELERSVDCSSHISLDAARSRSNSQYQHADNLRLAASSNSVQNQLKPPCRLSSSSSSSSTRNSYMDADQQQQQQMADALMGNKRKKSASHAQAAQPSSKTTTFAQNFTVSYKQQNSIQKVSSSATITKLASTAARLASSSPPSADKNNKQPESNLSNTGGSSMSSMSTRKRNLALSEMNLAREEHNVKLEVTEDTDNSSKREQVRKKWTNFKKSMNQSKKQLKLGLKTTQSDADSEYSSEAADDDSDDSLNDANDQQSDQHNQDNQQQPEDDDEVIEPPPVITNDGYYWIGKDYCNTYKQGTRSTGDFSKDQFDRTVTPRMPWRDQGLVMIGESARDLGRHFIQRWNQCKREKTRHNNQYPFLVPKSYSEPFVYDYSDWFKEQLFNCKVQITRSLDNWSGGVSETECSIFNAYCELIRKAEHYIYIENQFFITTTQPYKDIDVKNSIGLELVNRIKWAHANKKKFRVYVVLPLLPDFDNRNAIQAIQYYNVRSVTLGEFSIFKELLSHGIDPNQYMTFHGMRNWSILMGKLVQEIVYVHSKLMIVDDKYVICGSANINDRSLLGKRDSELAAVVHDEEMFEAQLDERKVLVGKYANSLRKKIFKLHLGIYFNNPKKIDVQDCVCDEFYSLFRTTSHLNTVVYDNVFKCLPSDNILSFESLSSYTSKPSLSKYDPIKGKEDLESKVNGYIVDFPLKFLSQERNYFPTMNTPEGIVPTSIWT